MLLYELLAGSTPFEGKRLHEAAFDEMLRIIREEEPPKPSTRLSSIDTLPSIAANRHTEPARLSKDVRGELDWIVMKALEKDRNRRYETASGFAADIERHLHDEPVEAGPPSAAYRFRKFARRNKAAVVMATVVGSAILLTMAGLAVSTVLITREQRATENALQAETLAKARPGAATRTSTASLLRTANCPPTTWAGHFNSSASVRKTCASGNGITSCGSAGSSRSFSGTRPRSVAWYFTLTANSSPPRAATGT